MPGTRPGADSSDRAYAGDAQPAPPAIDPRTLPAPDARPDIRPNEPGAVAERPAAAPAAAPLSSAAAASDEGRIARVQRALAQRGHDPGPVDGVHGPRTAEALRAFQRANGLPPSGQADAHTLQLLDLGGGIAR